MHRDWEKRLAERLRGNVVVACVGSRLAGDDALGPLVGDELAKHASLTVFNCETVPENFLMPIVRAEPHTLVVVDCVEFGAEPGEIDLFETDRIGHSSFSTHSMTPSLFIEFVQKETGADCFILGVQPDRGGSAAGMSRAVKRAAERIVAALAHAGPS